MPFSLTEKGQESKHFALVDNKGYIYTEKEVHELLDKIKGFYEVENVNILINNHNKLTYLEGILQNYAANYDQTILTTDDGLFELPQPHYKCKTFNPEKRNWSFTCNWCGEKVSSKKDDKYYTLNNSIFDVNMERACTETCAKLIWYDKIKEWVYDREYEEFFSFEKDNTYLPNEF